MEKTIPFELNKTASGQPVIIYGASVYGELAYYALAELGITPDYFCDRARTGKYFGIEIIHPEKLNQLQDANIIIASCDYFDEIRIQLLGQGCRNLFDMRSLLSMRLPTEKMTERAKAMYAYAQVYDDVAEHQGMLNFHRLQFVVTERCSLRCRDCMHLMQYYKKPQDIDLDTSCRQFDHLLSLVDNVSELRVLGGEPFMNKEVYRVLDHYAASPKIETITVYTNGTIVPNEQNLKSLQNEKIIVNISDYRHNQERIRNVVAKLEEYHVKYFLRQYDSWQDCGDISERGYTKEEKEKLFMNCFERGCYTFYKGQLHRCPRSVHAMNLGAMPDVKEDYVDFSDETLNDDILKQQLHKLRAKTWIEACNYCSGPDIWSQSVTPAIQAKQPLAYVNQYKK